MNLPISIRARASTTSGTWIWTFRPTSSSYSAALPAPENLPWRSIRFFRIPQAFSGLPVGTLQAGHGSTGKPEVDSITGLPPALCLEQSARQQSSRTLLGSITEILDYLRILYAAAGTPHDPETGKELERKSPDRITEELVSLPEHTRLILAASAENLLAQDPAATLGDFQRQGFLRVYWNGEMRDIEEISSPVPRLRTRPWSLTASSSEGKIRPRALRIPCKRLSVSIRTRFGPSSPYRERKPQSGPSTPATAIRKQASFCPSLRPAIFPSTPRWGHAPPAGEPA